VTTLTKTLELKLVEPNAHKRRKLRETREAYQQALHDAFDAGCTTQTEANDVVVNYKLSGYAKNALKKYVPQLTTTYNAGELHDAHPVRFTNEGLRLRPQARERYRVVRQNPAPRGLPPLDASTTESRTTGLVGSVERGRRR